MLRGFDLFAARPNDIIFPTLLNIEPSIMFVAFGRWKTLALISVWMLLLGRHPGKQHQPVKLGSVVCSSASPCRQVQAMLAEVACQQGQPLPRTFIPWPFSLFMVGVPPCCGN